jgi:hypothetical protein
MKKLLILTALILASISLWAQKSPIDDVFDRYSGKDGFTTVYISPKMFSILSGMNSEDKDFQNLVSKIKNIRILSEKGDSVHTPTFFGKELLRRLPSAGYEDLMMVKDESGEVRFMILEVKGRIAELVMVSGGTGSTLVSITGDLDLKTIASLSDKTGIEELKDLDKVEKKP